MVTAYSVLHHIEDLGQVFREVRRTLKPGGVFYADESISQHYLDALLDIGSESVMSDDAQLERKESWLMSNRDETRYGLPADVVKRRDGAKLFSAQSEI